MSKQKRRLVAVDIWPTGPAGEPPSPAFYWIVMVQQAGGDGDVPCRWPYNPLYSARFPSYTAAKKAIIAAEKRHGTGEA